jgi:hypothetical protein
MCLNPRYKYNAITQGHFNLHVQTAADLFCKFMKTARMKIEFANNSI